MKLNNPFVVRGYSGPEYFCDREKETAELLCSLENDGDVTLIAPRRYGKTGLILNAFSRLPKDVVSVYLDIYATRNLSEFTKLFAETVVGALASNAEATLKDAFEYLTARDRRVVIAIDEFQQVLEYPESGTEALLRGFMQRTPNVHFVFSGSRQHLMRKMFLTPRHPFYQSTDILSLRPIPCQAYSEFAGKFFLNKRKPFDEGAFKSIYDRFGGITWYVQMALRRLWIDGVGLPDVGAVDHAIDDIVGSRQQEYLDLFLSQNDAQQRLLKAIARERLVPEPLAGDFIARHSLRATSTVSAALRDLVERDFVYRTESGCQVYDRFFDIWLRTLP